MKTIFTSFVSTRLTIFTMYNNISFRLRFSFFLTHHGLFPLHFHKDDFYCPHSSILQWLWHTRFISFQWFDSARFFWKIPKYTLSGGSSVCFGSIETSKLSVSVLKRNNRNKRFVSDSAETSFGSSFGCFESKLFSKDTLVHIHILQTL
jgi:hypothetical protein